MRRCLSSPGKLLLLFHPQTLPPPSLPPTNAASSLSSGGGFCFRRNLSLPAAASVSGAASLSGGSSLPANLLFRLPLPLQLIMLPGLSLSFSASQSLFAHVYG